MNTNLEAYNFYMNPEVVNNMYTLMITGGNDRFTENGRLTQGSERGGNFCYRKHRDKSTIEIIGFIQSDLMPGTTSLNSGDFPFTFHTHPIVIKLGNRVNEPSIDNYPNVMSSEDLIGSIEDNYYYNHQTDRSLCNKIPSQKIGGINFFDILAVPYGLFVYRPNKEHDIMNKPINLIERECDNILLKSTNLMPKYTVSKSMRYFDISTTKSVNAIKKYLVLLRKSGFVVDFFPWSNATAEGIHFIADIPSQSPIDNICMC